MHWRRPLVVDTALAPSTRATMGLGAGITCMAALAAFGLALPTVPPSVPEGA